ncbi:MAG: hypothetical protein H8E55_62265 [Pelagibacterales bacterium]|nr:hypothetical protein [Pelagibacterales bacterium]
MSNDDSSIVIRVFSSNGCRRCKMFREECKKFGLPHIIIDANADENQDICDKYEVNDLPHIQIIRETSGLVLLEYVGYIHPVSMLSTLKKKLKSRAVKKVKVEGISESDIIADNKDGENKGCSSCGRKKKNEP